MLQNLQHGTVLSFVYPSPLLTRSKPLYRNTSSLYLLADDFSRPQYTQGRIDMAINSSRLKLNTRLFLSALFLVLTNNCRNAPPGFFRNFGPSNCEQPHDFVCPFRNSFASIILTFPQSHPHNHLALPWAFLRRLMTKSFPNLWSVKSIKL